MANDVTSELPSNRSFGFFFSGVFGLVFLYGLWVDAFTLTLVMAVLAALTFTITLVRAELLTPFNRLWMAFGNLLGRIISPLVVGILFFLLITPLALLLRLFGRDEMALRKTKKTSHWKIRDHSEQTASSLKNQF